MFQTVINNINSSVDTSPEIKKQFLEFLANNKDTMFSRENSLGHVTCSMLVLNEERTEVLLTEHAKFNKWLQFGGHNDLPNETPLEAAIREMLEEGFDNKKVDFNLLINHPIDIDAHMAGNHMHYDICFVCTVNYKEKVVCSKESKKVEWKTTEEVVENKKGLYDDRLIRMVSKSLQLNHSNNLSKHVENMQALRLKENFSSAGVKKGP